MKPLTTIRLGLTWLSIFPADESTDKWRKRAYKIFGISVVLWNLVSVIGSVAYFLKFKSTNMKSALCTVYQIFGLLNAIYGAIFLFLSRHKFLVLFTHLSEIYDANINEDIFGNLMHTNNKSEWLTNFFFENVLGGIVFCLTIGPVITILICWMTNGNFDGNYVYHFQVVFPWNQTTPIGYIGEIFVIDMGGFCYFFIIGLLMLLFISMCWHHEAFYEMFRYKLLCRDRSKDEKETFSELVRFHILVKDWFLESANIFSPYIVVQLISNMIVMACAVYHLDLVLQDMDLDICVILLSIVSGLLNLFVWCYFGKRATESHLKMADCLYESNWQDLPIGLQKHVLLMMANAQRPLRYHAFGVPVVNLELFCTMLNRVYSYYMIFKTLSTK